MKFLANVGVFLCVSFTFCNVITSQAQGMLSKTDLKPSIRSVGVSSIYDAMNGPLDEDDPVVGTPYFYEKYISGILFTRVGNFRNIEIRYNVYQDRIEFKDADSVLAIGADSIIHKVNFGKHTLVVDKYPLNRKVLHSYYFRLDSGKITLMSKPVVIFKERVEPKPIQTDGSPPTYVRSSHVYYVKVGKGWPVRISGMKGLIDVLPDKKKEMEEFARREKISAKDERDLTTFFRHYNSL